ncbi:hypothetical protein D9M69_431010 [compost metagenome]
MACGDVADHADHQRLARGGALDAAAHFDPVQAAVGPADAVAEGGVPRAAGDDVAEALLHLWPVFLGNQGEVFEVAGRRLFGVEAEQRLRAARPADLAALHVPQPGAQAGAVERGEQARGVRPVAFGQRRGDGRDGGQGEAEISGVGHGRFVRFCSRRHSGCLWCGWAWDASILL